MHEDINTDIHLQSWKEGANEDFLKILLQAGFTAEIIKEDIVISYNEEKEESSAVFFVYDNVIKSPQDVLVSLCKETKGTENPVIILSGRYDETRENQFLNTGVYDYLIIEEVTAFTLKRTITRTISQYLHTKQKDITLHQLKESEHKFRLITENSQDLITVFSPGIFYEYVSPSVKQHLGFEPEELLGKTPFQVFTLEDIEKLPLKNKTKHALDKYHYRIKHKNGEFIWFETCIKPFHDDKGKIIQILATSKNITKRKRLSFMLEEMQHLARVGAWEYYLEKDKIYATGEVSNIFGTSKDRNMGFREILSLFTTTSQKMMERELGQTLEYGKSWDLELSFYNNKGQIQWVRTVGQAYFMNGKVYKIGGTIQDISERINYEDLLYKKQSELKAFVENTPAAIAMFDKNMKYIAATNRWCEDYGIKEKNVIGQPHEDIFPKSTSNWKKIYEKCLNGSIEKKEEDKILFYDGKVEWLKWEIRPWYSHRNEIGGLIAMSEIITSRKEEEELANQQQKRMREIYQITSDITGDISDRIEKVIEKATIALGMDYGILSKISNDNYLIKEFYDATKSLKLELKSFPLSCTLCSVIYSENGVVAIGSLSQSPYENHPTVASIKTESYIGVPVWKSGNKYGTLSFSSKVARDDFSQADQDFVQLLGQWIGAAIDRRIFERELVVAKEKAEEASKTKAQFVSTMSHEIRTPLNAVVGITHLLLEQDPKPDQIKNLSTLQFSANNLLALINDILDFSKIESGKIEIEEIDYDIREMLDRLFSVLEYKATEKAIDLTMNISPDLPNRLKGDPIRLNQILTNLISNAVKFTDIGGVNLSVEVVKESEKDIHVKFVVTDTGIGIAKEKLENIFESFTQASSDTSRKYGGTGLGLSISKKLAEIQGGRIDVESTLGKGSAFTLNLRFDKAVQKNTLEKEKVQEGASVDVSGSLILLVEDNEVNQMVAKQFLQRKGVETDIVKNGVLALEKIQSKKYNLVLMDLQMPEMDGYEAARRIRSYADPYYKNVPIIALTASTMSEVRNQVFASGMNDYISKPFIPKTFYDCIDKYLNKAHQDALTTPSEEVSANIEFEKVFEFTYGEKSFYLELLAKIKEEIFSFNQQFIEAVEQKDLEKIGFLKHRLTSSLKILGLHELDKNIEAVRVLISKDASDVAAVQPLVHMVDLQCKKAVQYLKEELEKG